MFIFSGSWSPCPLSVALPIPLVGAELLSHICLIRFCVDVSFCCIIKQLVDSLEQNNKTNFYARTIKESIYIRVNNPTLK